MAEQVFTEYDAIREEMKQGDVVAFYGRSTPGDLIYRLLLWASGMGYYTHIAIVRREEFLGKERVWVVETEPGIGGHVQALSRYDGRKFDVYDCPDGVDPAVAVSNAMLMLDRIRKYNWLQILELMQYGFIRRFTYWIRGYLQDKLPPLTDSNDALVCSSFVAQVLTTSGWQKSQPSRWPDEVARHLGKPIRLKYRPAR